MSEEVCANCSHRAQQHSGTACHQATFRTGQTNIAVYCECKAYRTLAQVQALQGAVYALASPVKEVPAKIVKDVLEAFS